MVCRVLTAPGTIGARSGGLDEETGAGETRTVAAASGRGGNINDGRDGDSPGGGGVAGRGGSGAAARRWLTFSCDVPDAGRRDGSQFSVAVRNAEVNSAPV